MWSRRDRHRLYGRAQPCRNQSDVFDSPKPYCATPTRETKIHHSIEYAPGILLSAAPTLPKKRNGKIIGLEAAWKLAKKILKLKEEKKTTFFSPTEKWCLFSPYKIEPEERDFVVDSGASMHLKGRKDLISAELGTVTTSRCPTTDITATGEVQTHVQAKVYVKEWDIFLTLKILEETPAVLSLTKLCENH